MDIRAAVDAVQAACPGVPLGMSTRQEFVPDLALVETIPGISPGPDGITAAQDILAELGAADVLVHGENEWAWPVLRWAVERGYDVRLGPKDMLTGPDGQAVESNADLLSYL